MKFTHFLQYCPEWDTYILYSQCRHDITSKSVNLCNIFHKCKSSNELTLPQLVEILRKWLQEGSVMLYCYFMCRLMVSISDTIKGQRFPTVRQNMGTTQAADTGCGHKPTSIKKYCNGYGNNLCDNSGISNGENEKLKRYIKHSH